MKEKIDTQSKKETGAPFVIDGGGPVFSAWEAAGRSRVSGHAMTEAEERARSDLVKEPKGWELDEWKQFKVNPPLRSGAPTTDAVGTRRALTRKEAMARRRERRAWLRKGIRIRIAEM